MGPATNSQNGSKSVNAARSGEQWCAAQSWTSPVRNTTFFTPWSVIAFRRRAISSSRPSGVPSSPWDRDSCPVASG